jgi:hypothetical protein
LSKIGFAIPGQHGLTDDLIELSLPGSIMAPNGYYPK